MSDSDKANLAEEIKTILGRLQRPSKAIVTAGMPYANGPLHAGHLAGAQVPADIYARYMRMMIGGDNVLFVNGTDDHGSNSQVAAKKNGIDTNEFINQIHAGQMATMQKYSISQDTYTGTSREETYEIHKDICQDFLRDLLDNNMLDKKTSEQWYDPEMKMFLPDRYVTGTCPKCEDTGAYSEECDTCGAVYEAKDLKDPKSAVSDATPELRETDHWYLNMWNVVDQLREWLSTKQKSWRKSIINEVFNNVHPSVTFSNKSEETFKSLKEQLPKHKSRYAPGKMIVVQFDSLADLEAGKKLLEENDIQCELVDGWAHRSITRDVSWAIPVPEDKDPSMKGKTLYVWPESLIAPISFTKVALKNKGLDPATSDEYWKDPNAKIYQFLGQDNVFFYVLMQGAMWFGTQKDIHRMPEKGELNLTEVFSSYHLQIDGAKMSKSKGNFYTADQLIDEMGYHPDQIRYFLALLSLSEKNSNLDFETLKERNKFLAGPLNAAFEKPISACNSKFGGVVPEGELIGKTFKETRKIVQTYVKMMERAEYSKILFMIENYARIINSLFAQFKPHDDRHDEKQRADALHSCFYILKNLVIMLHPFAPETMEKVRKSLNLPEDIYSLDNLGNPFPSDHKIGEQDQYFPAVD